MAGMFQKLHDNHLLVEAICFLVIAIAMALLLYRVVWPNFGNKSVALGFMTAAGSLIILAYAIFMELKPTQQISEVISYTAFDSETKTPARYSIPPKVISETAGLFSGTISFHQPHQKSPTINMSEQALELTLVNIAMILTGDFKDWKKTEIRTPSSLTTYLREPENKSRNETLLTFLSIIEKLELNTLTVNLEKMPKHLQQTYSAIYPEKISLKSNKDSILLNHPLFQITVKVDRSNQHYLVDGSGSVGTGRQYYIMQIPITIKTTKKAKLNGHKKEEEYTKFLSELSDLLRSKLHVESHDIPMRKSFI